MQFFFTRISGWLSKHIILALFILLKNILKIHQCWLSKSMMHRSCDHYQLINNAAVLNVYSKLHRDILMLSIINTLNLNSIEIPSGTVHSTMAHSLILHYAFGNSEMGYEWAWFFSTLQNTILSIRQCRQTPLTDMTQTAMDYIKKQACTRAVCHFTFHVSSMWRCWKEHRTGEEDYVTRDDDQSSQYCYESNAVKPWVETWESRLKKKQCLSSDTAGEGASTFGKMVWKVCSVALQG